jgi:predicted MPP superfamily phosphohydrolase
MDVDRSILSPSTDEEVPLSHLNLRDRLGAHHYRQRMNIEHYHAAEVFGGGRTRFHPENFPVLRQALELLLRATLTYGWGNRNARRHQIVERDVLLRRLPPAFEGFRILHLSDLHLDMDPKITTALAEAVQPLEYDLCVITGDYRGETFGPFDNAMQETRQIIKVLKQPCYGILGNHDFLGMAPILESMGLRMLLNEHVRINRDGGEIYLAGIDDPHYYETEDLEQALAGIPQGATTILLSHTAETYRKALACGIDLMLSGHTHAGQICLPGGWAPLRNAQHPRAMDHGSWSYHELQGYTSAGVGCSMVPVRFFCPPEIVIHTLRRGEGR